jgi:hypothetical protein
MELLMKPIARIAQENTTGWHQNDTLTKRGNLILKKSGSNNMQGIYFNQRFDGGRLRDNPALSAEAKAKATTRTI